MIKIKDGFTGERSIVIPKMIIDMFEQDPLGRALHITDIGYYPVAKHHFINRKETIDQYVLIYCIEGCGWYKLNNVRYEVNANQFFILPKGQIHSYGADAKRPWTIYWCHFKGDLAEYYADGLNIPHSINPAADSRILDRIAIFEEIFYSLKNGYGIENLHYAISLFHHYLGTLRYIRQYRKAGTAHGGLPEVDVVDKTIRYMKENIERHITLKDVASYAGYSHTHLSQLFKQKMGYSPVSYFNLLKIQAACAMLDSTGMKIVQISQKLGFEDQLYFSRLFTKIMGVSPRKYRVRKDELHNMQ